MQAANNVIVVCKYYLEVVTKEITATTTYDPVARDKADIISDHLRYMSNNHITVKPELQYLPSFYWLPKLHKRPYGNRFIAASYRCTTKPLSKLLTSCLHTIITHFKQYCNGIYCKTGVNCFLVIDNSQQVLNTLIVSLPLGMVIVTIFLRYILVFHMILFYEYRYTKGLIKE